MTGNKKEITENKNEGKKISGNEKQTKAEDVPKKTLSKKADVSNKAGIPQKAEKADKTKKEENTDKTKKEEKAEKTNKPEKGRQSRKTGEKKEILFVAPENTADGNIYEGDEGEEIFSNDEGTEILTNDEGVEILSNDEGAEILSNDEGTEVLSDEDCSLSGCSVIMVPDPDDPESKLLVRMPTEIFLRELERMMTRPQKAALKEIIGQEEAVSRLSLLLSFLEDPETFREWTPRLILFEGPKGAGKRLTAEAAAKASGVSLTETDAGMLRRKYEREGQQAIRELYGRAGRKRPGILFIRDLDQAVAAGQLQSSREGFGNISRKAADREIPAFFDAVIEEAERAFSGPGPVCTIFSVTSPEIISPEMRRYVDQTVSFRRPVEDEIVLYLSRTIPGLPVFIEPGFSVRDFAGKLASEGFTCGMIREKIMKPALSETLSEGGKVISAARLEDNLRKASEMI
ncbi:AAA family ATPase [Methanosarcinaceae archaeon]|nr:AAA family ATPase [Methanosarcinaceae archaeon]